MIGRRAVVGLSLAGAVLLCTFGAQNSLAALTTSKNTTAFTCAPEGGNRDFLNDHCDAGDTVTSGTGSFGHVAISGSTTEIEATNCEVTSETKDCEPAVLKSTVNLVKTEITCTTVKSNSAESSLENSEPEPKAHTLSGTGVTEFSSCTVNKPEKCIVKEPIVAGAKVHGVEGVEGPKGEKNAMGGEALGSGVEETFAVLEYKNKGAESCGLVAAKVKGKLIATSGPTTEFSQATKRFTRRNLICWN